MFKDRKHLLWLISGFELIAFLLTSCFFNNSETVTTIPDTDIVYQKSDRNKLLIGFVNADGSDQVTLSLDKRILRPVWSSDGKIIYGIYSPDDSMDHWGNIVIWEEGQRSRLCKDNRIFNIVSIGTVVSQENSNQALLTYLDQWWLFDLDKCKILEIYNEPSDNQTIFAEQPSLSFDGKQIVYVEVVLLDANEANNTIKILTIDTMEIETVSEMKEKLIRTPALSPDKQWVAYRGAEGISIIAVDGTQNKFLILYPIRNPITGIAYGSDTVGLKWSPDSEWIIYHKCMQPKRDCRYVKDFSIFKVNIITDEEVKIVDSGLFPYWRSR